MHNRDAPKGEEQRKPTPVEVVGKVSILPVRLERPVRIQPPTADQWSAQTLVCGPVAVEVAGGQLRRARAILRNLDAEHAILLHQGHTGHRSQAFVLAPGAELEVRHTEPIYATAATGSPELTWIVEHDR